MKKILFLSVLTISSLYLASCNDGSDLVNPVTSMDPSVKVPRIEPGPDGIRDQAINLNARIPAGNSLWEADPADTRATTYFDINNDGSVNEKGISTQSVAYSYNIWHDDDDFLFVDDPTRYYNVALPLHNPEGLATAWYWDWDKSAWLELRELKLTTALAYGTQRNIGLNDPIPENWVLTGVRSTYRTITFIGGAPYRAQLNIVPDTDVPDNWVITGERSDRTTITHVGGASYGSTVDIVPDTPQPADWVVISVQANYWRLKYVGGASYGQIERIHPNVAQPSNWIVILAGTNTPYWEMKYVGGASVGTQEQVVIGGGFPDGWTIVGTNNTGTHWIIRYDG